MMSIWALSKNKAAVKVQGLKQSTGLQASS